MMNPAQQTTLQAFVLAMTKLELPIAPEVEAILPSIKQDLEQQPDHAVQTVKQLAKTHEQFGQQYQAARQELRQHYSSQERDKFRVLGFGETATLQPSRMTRSLTQLSTDFADIAQWVLNQVREQDDMFCSLLNMRMAVTHGRARLLEFSILSALEQRPLTTEDLAYHLEMPIDQVSQVIEKLWQMGKIDSMGSGLIQKLFPMLKKRSRPNPDAHWTLTAIGHFRLHPIISLRHLGV